MSNKSQESEHYFQINELFENEKPKKEQNIMRNEEVDPNSDACQAEDNENQKKLRL
jgi:hypothetical protein